MALIGVDVRAVAVVVAVADHPDGLLEIGMIPLRVEILKKIKKF